MTAVSDSNYLQQALALAGQQADIPAWLADLRQQGEQLANAHSWPTRKTENWKYTNLNALNRQAFATQADSTDNTEALSQYYNIADLNAHQLVFVNGQFSEQLSSDGAPDNVELVRFSQANEEQQQLIKQHLGQITVNDQHVFGALNDSLVVDGFLVRFAKNQKAEQPVQIVQVTTAQEQAFSVVSRVLVIAEQGSQGTLVESFVSDEAEQNSIVNNLTECQVEANAKLYHYRLQLEQENAIHVGGMHVNLEAGSQIESFHIGLGSEVKRVDIVVNHRGSGAHCDLKGVYLPQNKQHIDYHTTIEHAVPHCTTDEVFRGIIADQAKAVFNGRIHIHKDAQKTLAELNNRNLLLSNKAEINTKPELEIYADDVRCAHGATIAQLDNNALSYMLSRGISRQEAEVMLSFGFINELLDGLAHHPIQEKLRPILAQLFGKDESLTRHLI